MSVNHTIPEIECGGPDSLPAHASSIMIPGGIHAVYAPAVNYSAPWMDSCCTPNPVHWVNGCYVWCELPEEFLHQDDKGTVWTSFDACLQKEDRPLNESQVYGWVYWHSSGTVVKPAAGGVLRWAMVGLAVVGMIGL